jgi:anti-sigma-K factor RskA
MDIKEYIQSGIIEQYVLGLATNEEVAELEQLRFEYPELGNAISEFEQTLEMHIRANTIEPPSHLKSLIEKELFREPDTSTGVVNEPTYKEHLQQAPIYNIGPWRYIAAACIVLLIASTALNFYFYSGYKRSEDQYEALLIERNTLQANNASFKQSFQMMMLDTTMRHIQMTALPGKENNYAMVVWDPHSKDVYIYAGGMQQTPEGKQYQLWAIVDGKPVNAGLIRNDCVGLCKIGSIDHAQAFAITLENEGGSATPTLTAMYVMGKVS